MEAMVQRMHEKDLMKGKQQPEMPSDPRGNIYNKEFISERRKQARDKYTKDRVVIQLERERRILEDRDQLFQTKESSILD